jgi:hypothetical protein
MQNLKVNHQLQTDTVAFEDRVTRNQIRDFANTLDAVSLILKRIRFRAHKLRDTVDALQGIAGGRYEFNCSHATLARRLEHRGEERAAEMYAFRKVGALKKEQARIGVMLFTIESGGGIDHKPMHYTDHLTRVANWAMRQARASERWKEHPGKALSEQIDAAIEMLPKATGDDDGERESMPLDDGLLIQRDSSQALNGWLRACDRVAKNGGDPIAFAALQAERFQHQVKSRYQARPLSDLQKCRSETRDAFAGSQAVPAPPRTAPDARCACKTPHASEFCDDERLLYARSNDSIRAPEAYAQAKAVRDGRDDGLIRAWQAQDTTWEPQTEAETVRHPSITAQDDLEELEREYEANRRELDKAERWLKVQPAASG